MGKVISLDRRLAALEAQRGNLSHLTDDQLRNRIWAACEGLEREGIMLPDGWRETRDFAGVLDAAREQAARLNA